MTRISICKAMGAIIWFARVAREYISRLCTTLGIFLVGGWEIHHMRELKALHHCQPFDASPVILSFQVSLAAPRLPYPLVLLEVRNRPPLFL